MPCSVSWATALSRSVHRMKPTVARSASWAMSSLTALTYRFILPANSAWKGPTLRSITTNRRVGWVVEEQVEDELLPSDLQRPLSPSEVEALTKSEHETLDVAQQSRLQVTLPGALGQLHEIQHQRVAGDSLHSLSIARLQGLLEIRDGRRLTLMQPSRDRR